LAAYSRHWICPGAGEITLVSDEDHFTFKPMLYEYLSGEVAAWHIAPNYSELLC
jgi:NADH dehydrogenase FAD-containing subunit